MEGDPVEGGRLCFDAAHGHLVVCLDGDDAAMPVGTARTGAAPAAERLEAPGSPPAPAWTLRVACGRQVARVLCRLPGLMPDRARLTVLATPADGPVDHVFDLRPGAHGGALLLRDGKVLAWAEHPRDIMRDLMVRLAELALAPHSPLVLLHAAAVVVNDVPLVLTAPSGGGKTTLACALHLGGGQLISDDTVVVSATDDSLAGVPAGVRLRAGGWALVADRMPVGAPPVHATAHGSRIIAPDRTGRVATRSGPPAAVVVLHRRPGLARPNLSRLSAAEGLVGIIAAGASAAGAVDRTLCAALAAWADRTTFLWLDYDRLDDGEACLVDHTRRHRLRHGLADRPSASSGTGHAHPRRQ